MTVNTLRFSSRVSASLASLFLLAGSTAASAAVSAPHFASGHPALDHLAILPQISAVFPAIGLFVAAWATQHVRRRNARQLAANKQ